MFRCGIIGVSGKRARGIADAYRHIRRGKVVAVATRQADKLRAFADAYGVTAQYTDYREMFAREKLDLVHVNTPPAARLEIFEAADQAGVPALICEKPLAMQGEDWRSLRDFEPRCRVKIAINHQLHFHPRRAHLQQLVRDGAIGDIRFIDGSAGMNLAFQGTHILQGIGAFNPGGKPTTVFGQASGTAGLKETPRCHYAPDDALASMTYDNGVSALLRCGAGAPRVAGDFIWLHKRLAVYGTRGHVAWSMWGWETLLDGVRESGAHVYDNEDILGQAAMTEAMFDWLLADTAVHPLNLRNALRDYNVILGLYTSVIHHRPVELPVEPEDQLLDQLRQALT